MLLWMPWKVVTETDFLVDFAFRIGYGGTMNTEMHMSTIRAWIADQAISSRQARVANLVDMKAPQFVIDHELAQIAAHQSGEIKIGGETELLDIEVVSAETKTGRGGKPFVVFNGEIAYFPKAKFGRLIKRL